MFLSFSTSNKIFKQKGGGHLPAAVSLSHHALRMTHYGFVRS
jgi:hypothetical protein